MKRIQTINRYTLLAALCLVLMSFLSCTKTTAPLGDPEEKEVIDPKPEPEPQPDPPPGPVLEGFVVASVSGVIDQGGTAVITGNGFTTETNASLFFTDFEHGILGEGLVGDISWLRGAVKSVPGSYRYADNAPLTGTKVARAAPTKTSFGDLYAALPNLEECFVEFFYRYDIVDFSATPDPPQIKHTRLTSGDKHTSAPFLGLSAGPGGNPNITFQNSPVQEPSRYTAYSYLGKTNWHRDTYYRKNSTPGVADGMSFIRTSFGNQWTYSGSVFFATPDEWAEPASMTRGLGSEGTTFKRFFFPFYQRAQQSTILDINHIYIHNSLERVYLSTSPTATASIDYQHVTCPTISRTATGITFKSMIGCLPVNEAVYLYVVNADNEMNEEGFLVRAAL